ncbi:MAG TPA: NAD(P)H-dependent oxidoreductase subunit E [Solirubrobacterales bacterium]|nr:NAD(P)H-dependent oxidoreductase subunit E [Solirubrobacterales bacterium]
MTEQTDQIIALRYEDAIPQIADVDIPDDLLGELKAQMAKYPDRRSAALPCLAAAQKVHGWCSPTALRQVAAVMRVTPAYLVSVASFYDMLETTERGRHTIYMCTNLSCMLRGANAVLAELEAALDTKNFSVSSDGIYLREFECLGACDIAPMASVNGEFVGPLTPDDAKALVEDLRGGREVLPDKQLKKRPIAATYWADGDPDRSE